jgi:hypothetical protein
LQLGIKDGKIFSLVEQWFSTKFIGISMEVFMSTNSPRGFKGLLRFTREALAIVISIISFVISTVNVYVTNLKSPDLSMIVAPYIRQVVDNSSLNEAFFVPLTIVNQGARPGSLTSFELVITYLPTGEQETYYSQYFAQENNAELLGSFFSPLNLAGYSSDGRTVCFYPLGKRDGNFFAETGTYQFAVTGIEANVRGQPQKSITQVFNIDLTDEMRSQMQQAPDHEYPYPMPIEVSNSRKPLIDILRNMIK